jgi:predicted DNA-binding transcriptional regulator AlpA
MNMEDRYITIKEVTDRLEVCKASIYSWAKSGLFPKQKKFGSSSRWSLQEIEEWLKNRPKGAYGEGK